MKKSFEQRLYTIDKLLHGNVEQLASMQAMYQDMLSCTKCSAIHDCKAPIPAIGNTSAKIVFVGRNPGKTEDAEGVPFVGKGGKLMLSFMERCGLSTTNILLTNLVKCHTKADRVPTSIEITCCSSWIKQELETIKPELVVTFGVEATKSLTGFELRNARHLLHSYPKGVGLDGCYVICCMHPGAVLHNNKYASEFMSDADYLRGQLVVLRSNGLLV